MDLYFGKKQAFKVKMSKSLICFLQKNHNSYSLHKTLINGLELLELLRCILSAVWTLILTIHSDPFTADDQLVNVM